MKKLSTFLILLFYVFFNAQNIPISTTGNKAQKNTTTTNRGIASRASSLPYYTDFTVNDFTLVNGTETNKWHAGTAAGNTGASIYVSNDNGVTNAYANNSTSIVHAYNDFAIPAGTTNVSISFDWRGDGENNFDDLSVFLAPDTYTPSAGTVITVANGIMMLGRRLSKKTTWQSSTHPTVDVSSFAGGNMRLIFQWRNDGSVGKNPPSAVDNLEISIANCAIPTNARVTGNSMNSATVAWDAPSPAPAQGYEYYFNSTGVSPNSNTSGTPVTNTTATLTGLAPVTNYYWWVRSICNGTDKSIWVPGPEVVIGQIGIGNATSSDLPIKTNWGYNYSQMVYTANEIMSAVGNSRLITKISYYVESVANEQDKYKSWKIYMANSTQNSFANNTSWIPFNQLTQVFDGDIPQHTSGQWMEITLNVPFLWDGTSNLVIAVDENSQGYTGTTDWGSYPTTGQPRAIMYRDDNTNPNPASPPTATARPNHLPRLRMVADDLIPCTNAAPNNPHTTNITDVSARLLWQSVQADAYVVEWRPVTNPASAWTTVAPNPLFSFHDLTGLAEQTEYEFRVANICNGTQGNFSTPVKFKTLPLLYCASASTANPPVEFINNVTIQPTGFPVLPTVSFDSAASNYTDNYPDATKKIRLIKGSTGNTISVGKGFGGTPTNVAVSAWIDFNRDGIFDGNEQILNLPPTNATPVTDTFDVPAVVHNSNYLTKMRVIVMKTNSPSACGSYTNGETEDYAVEFVDMIPCNNSAPQNVTINNITSTSATINWTADPGGAQYVIRYREVGSNNWANALPAAALSTTLQINNLTPATNYEVSITAICGGIEGTPTLMTFNTVCSDDPVSNFMVSQIGTTTAQVSWNPLVTATYVLQYRAIGTPGWQTVNLNTTTHTLTNLLPNTKYEVKVATVCSGTTNSFNTPEVFTTLPTCEMPPVGLTISNITMTNALVEWNAIPNATYVLQWRKVGSNAGWNTINVDTNEYLLTGLTESTNYELKIANVCNGVQKAFTDVYEFVTPALGYCTMTPVNTDKEYISNVTIDAVGFDEMSNDSNDSGYTSYVNTPNAYIKLIRGSQNNKISITKSWKGSGMRNSAVTVWIDFNRDGVFSNHERVLISPSNGQDLVEGTFNVPADSFATDADGKYTVMRVTMNRGSSPELCTNAQFGEVEDYRVIISTVNQFEIAEEKEINIYPNPAKDVLHITQVENGTKYTIYNSVGQVVHIGIIYNNKIDLSNIAGGVYVIDIESEKLGRTSKKFIKQ